jgi:hypothetical protein
MVRWLMLALVVLAGCSSIPHADDTNIAAVRCETVGQGFSLEADLTSVLDVGQRVMIAVELLDQAAGTQAMEGWIWTCGAWSELTSGDVVLGCRRDADQPEQVALDYRHDQMLTAGALPIPTRVRVTPRVFAVDSDTDSTYGADVEADCTSP